MATLGMIISRMRAAGESQENIDATRAEYERLNAPKPVAQTSAPRPVQRANIDDPGSFWGGVGESFRSGEALKAGVEGAGGYFKGAVLNIPKTIAAMARDAGEVISNPAILSQAGAAYKEGLPAVGRQIADVTSRAGSDPGAFGEMIGELMGQPAVTAGIMKFPGALNRVGPINRTISAVGRGLEGTPPPRGVPTTPRGIVAGTVRAAASPVGRGLQRIGERGRLGAAGAETAGEQAARTTGRLKPSTGAIPVSNLRDRPRPTPPVDPNNPFVDITARAAQNTSVADPRFAGGPVETAGELAARKPKPTAPPSIPSEPPPNAVPPGSQPPITETAGEMAARGPQPTASSFEQPVPSEADPMFQSPLETTGDLAARQRYQNRSLYPERTPRPARPIPEAPGEVLPESQPPILETAGERAARTTEPTPVSTFEQPVPSEADPMFQSDLETAAELAARAPEAPPSVFSGEPVPSEADPMFRSPPNPQGARLTRPALTPDEELLAAVEEARRELTQEPSVGFQPDPYSLGESAPPTQPRVTVTAPKTNPKYAGLSLEQLEAELAARKAGKPSTLKPKAEPAKAAPEPPKAEAPKAETAPEGVDTTTGEITEPTPPPLRAKRLKGNWNLFRSTEPGQKRPFGGYEEGSAEIPQWAERVAEWINKDRKPVSNRTMFERSAQVGAEEQAATRPKTSAFSDAVPGANEFSPDVVEGAENLFEGASPTFRPRGTTVVRPGGQSRIDDPLSGGRTLPEGQYEIQSPEGFVRLREDPSNPNHLTVHFSSVEPASRGQGIGSTLYEEAAKLAKDLGYEGITGNAADMNDASRGLWDKLSGTGRTAETPTGRTLTPEPPTAPKKSVVERAKETLKSETGSIGPDIKQTSIKEKVASEAKAAGKEVTGNLAGRLVKSGEYTRVKAKDVGPKGGAFRVEDPSGKHLGDIVVTPEEIAGMKAHEGGVLEDVPDNLLAQELYKNKFDEMMEKHGIREDALTRVKVTTKSNRTKNVEDATAPPKEKPKAKAKEGEPEKKVLPRDVKPNTSVLGPVTTPASYEGMPTRYKLKDPTNTNEMLAGRRKGYHVTYNEEGDVVMVRGDLITSEKMAAVPETAKAEPAPVKTERTGLDPDKAFAPGGDPAPIREALIQLRSVGATDARYRQLLPSNKQHALGKNVYGEPETWRSRLTEMFTHPTKEEIAKKAEVEKFVESVTGSSERQPRPVEGKAVEQVPLLRSKDVKFNPRPIKTVRNAPSAGNKEWISPRQAEMLRQMRKKHGE